MASANEQGDRTVSASQPRPVPAQGHDGSAPRHGLIVLGFAILMMVGCATNHGRFVRIGEVERARPADCVVELYRAGEPARAFVRVARLDVDLEKTHFWAPSFEEAWRELKRQACLAGADAVIEIEEYRSRVLETAIYHVTAIGVRFGE